MKDGEHIGYYKSGEISSKFFILDGKFNGEYISCYENGDISSKYYYINDNYATELEWLCYNRNLTLELIGL